MAARHILITGANGGIGLEIAAQLIKEKLNHVIVGSRSVQKGEAALKELQSRNDPGIVELLQIDVTSPDSVTAASKTVESRHGKLDVLVNNAAVAMFPPDTPIHEQMQQAFLTNATGPHIVGEAFAPLLKKATSTPRIVNVSSGAGSITRRLQPDARPMKAIQYQASKAALNMVTACQAVDYSDQGFKVFAVCPGFTVSNLSGMNKAENGAKPVAEGAKIIVDIINGERDEESGKFLRDGGQYEW